MGWNWNLEGKDFREENLMFEETLEISPPFRTSFYLVHRSSFDMYETHWSVSYFPGMEANGVVIGRFDIPRTLVPDCVRGVIMSKAEKIIMSRDFVLEEIPVFSDWDGIRVSSMGMIFGRRV